MSKELLAFIIFLCGFASTASGLILMFIIADAVKNS